MSLALHYWMGDAHHCSGPPSPKWPILCRMGRWTSVYTVRTCDLVTQFTRYWTHRIRIHYHLLHRGYAVGQKPRRGVGLSIRQGHHLAERSETEPEEYDGSLFTIVPGPRRCEAVDPVYVRWRRRLIIFHTVAVGLRHWVNMAYGRGQT